MPALSICIPTYNRSKYLRSNLLSIFNQIDEKDDIEIIVSDNCSTDDTPEIIKPFLQKKNFYYYRQQENLGAVRNVLKLVKEYAKGEFCWIVGDDDFLLQNAVKNVLTLLENNKEVDFVYAKTNDLDVKDYNQYLQPFHTGMIESQPLTYSHIEKWEELLRPKYSIIFLGELMASVFRRSIWLSYEITNIDHPYLSVLETTYPHSVILANTFVGKKAIYLATPTVLALSGAREWWYKVGYIIVVHVKSLLDLYKAKGVSKEIMNECYDAFIKLSVPFAVQFYFEPNTSNRENVSLRKYFKDLFKQNRKLTSKITLSHFKIHYKAKLRQYVYKIKKRLRNKPEEIILTDKDLNLDNFRKSNVDIPDDFSIAGLIRIRNEGKIKIGNRFEANSGEWHNMIGGDVVLRLITFTRNAELRIGSNVGISNSTIVCWNKITIEDNVLIGGGVKIWDTDFHSLDPKIRTSPYDYDVKTAPVHIKEYAFIGGGVTILKGVTIGKSSIIAAGSVVVKDIPDNVVAGGNPCKVIRSL